MQIFLDYYTYTRRYMCVDARNLFAHIYKKKKYSVPYVFIIVFNTLFCQKHRSHVSDLIKFHRLFEITFLTFSLSRAMFLAN